MPRYSDDWVNFDPQAARQRVAHWRELDDLSASVESLRPRLPDLDEDALLLIAVMGTRRSQLGKQSQKSSHSARHQVIRRVTTPRVLR